MNEAERWSEVSEILSQALDLPEAERARFVAESARKRPALRTELLAMAEELRDASEFLEHPPLERLRALSEFGPYRVIGELGEGGMGVVYLAERHDGQFSRRVAIKLVRGLAPGPEKQRRFRDERRILAGLDHPNIARLLDAGISSGGIPYLVMEHVEGQPITAWCREQGLGLRPRLELFLKVCEAVRHAHQNLVIHRDIKPANVLVTEAGEPKLLDFGIAKLLDDEAGRDVTETANRALTLDYASPEQLRGDPVNTATDVYSLGVVLYELTAGVKPYECDARALSDAVRLVCEEVPQPPSRAVASEHRAPLEGDLDAITAKAMEKAVRDRYGSVAELIQDVTAHLEHRPIRARRTSLRDAASKFARRHRAGVATAAAALTLVAVSVVAVGWQARVAERERARAQRRFDEVRRLANSVIYELHDAIQNLPGATPARSVLVERALEYVDSLAAEAADDVSLQRELAGAYQRLAQVQGGSHGANLGDTAGALVSQDKALAIRRRLADRRAPHPEDVVGLASLEFDRGTLLRTIGQTRRAVEFFLSAAARFEALREQSPSDDERLSQLGAVYQRLAEAQAFLGEPHAALANAERAVAETQSALAARPDDAALRASLSISLHQLAEGLAGLGRHAEALPHVRRARGLVEEALRDDPLDARQTRVLLFVLNSESRYLSALGDSAGAIQVAASALEVAERAWQRDPEDRWSQMGVAVAARELGNFQLAEGETREAARRLRRALDISREALAQDPGYHFARLEAAAAEHSLGRALIAMGTRAGRTEGCAALRRVQAFWAGLRAEDRLPPGEEEDLVELPGRLEACADS